MEPAAGSFLFVLQFKALFYKNILLSWRNLRATLLQLASSFIFIFLIFAIDKAIELRLGDNTYYKNLVHSRASAVGSIPACESGYYIKQPCYDFLWSGNSSSKVRSIVDNIMKNNPGRPIPAEKVMDFESTDDVDAWLYEHPMHCPGALHLDERNSSVIAYGVQTNSTSKRKRGRYEDPTFKFQIPLQAAAEREISRFLLGADIEWNVSFAEFAHPPTETYSTLSSAGPTFFLAATMFGFVIQLNNIVTEKELKLRQVMSVMGLLDSVYWSTWLLWETLLVFGASILLVLFGMIFQFSFFLHNSFGVLFFMFFLFQFNLISFAFLFSTFLSKASAANTVGFAIFIVGFLTQLVTVFGFPYDTSFSKGLRSIWSLFPPNLLAIGVKYLGDATASSKDEGISWAGRAKCSANNTDCVLTMDGIYKWLLSTFCLWFLLAIYFDNTLPNVNGVRKPWIYFLYPSYWIGDSRPRIEGQSSRSPTENKDEDVAAEAELVASSSIVDGSSIVQVRGLIKSFPGVKRRIGLCASRREPYHAVNGIWLNIEKNKLFCLLGPNGAGKTTLINCLTGILPITSGDALVYGNSVRSTRGMSIIRSTMGICPQFDILWDALTGREHLHLFASIKGLQPREVQASIEDLLSKVKLVPASNTRAGSYSGGMKRRLSLAVALIGDPKVLYLDEPTTGMDPITRRHVWDIIEASKHGRAVILTTHSMEEADVLGDRIGIMAKGNLQCLGTSIHLKKKFGAGYIVNINLSNGVSFDSQLQASEEQQSEIKYMFKQILNVEPKEEGQTYLTFIIPRSKESLLGDFFVELQNEEERLGISDIQLGLTTLDEVFLNISRKAELEASLETNQTETIILENDMVLKVPVGAQYVAVPGTESEEYPSGLMVEVLWQQDETGALCIFRNSELIPLPPHITPEGYGVLVSSSNRRSMLRRGSLELSMRSQD